MNTNDVMSIVGRFCLLELIPELADAARYLDAAVSAHLAGRTDLADSLIRLADLPVIRDWTECFGVLPVLISSIGLLLAHRQAANQSALHGTAWSVFSNHSNGQAVAELEIAGLKALFGHTVICSAVC